MNNPTLSVTITNYNYADYISQTIGSILKQTFEDFELIIIDNASTDNSVAIIKRYMEQDTRIKLIEHQQDQGVVASLIESGRLARGRYHVHIDADDWVIEPRAFEIQVAFLNHNPDITFVFSALSLFEDDKCILISNAYNSDTIQPGELTIEKILTLYVAHTGPMMRTSAYHACGGYDAHFPHAADLKLWHDLCIQGKVGYINQPLYASRQHKLSLSKSTKLQILLEEALQLNEIVFRGPLAQRMADPAAMRSRTVRKLLTHYAIQLVFSGEHYAAWRAYWVSVRLRPRETVFQKQTIALIIRSVLGAKGYQLLENLVIKMSRRKRQKVVVEAQLRNEIQK
jgi:glycosyltransferase involved in cell wall biosynthesis